MRRSLRLGFAAFAIAVGACSEYQLSPSQPDVAPTRLTPRFSLVAPPTQCPTVAESQKTVDNLLPQIFGPGQGRRGKAQGYSNSIMQARRNGDTQLERAFVDSLINYTLANYYAGNLIGGQSQDAQIRLLNFIYAMYCASSIHPIPDLSDVFSASNTVFLRNSSPTTTVSADSAAVQVEHGEVPTTVFGTYVSVFKTTTPLPTSLDWYGGDGFKQGAYEFVSNPPVEFTSPVLTGVCIRYDDSFVSPNDLRVAHEVPAGYTPTNGNTVLTTAGGTIEIAAYSDPGPLGLACDPLPAPTASRGFLGRVLHQFASLFVATPAWAGASGGSTGGQVRSFSPFAAVDIKLSTSSTGPSSPQLIPIGSTSITAPVSVTVKTRVGNTAIDGVAVAFAPSGSFSPASGTTGASGTVGSTWTLVAGVNTGSATPSLAPLVIAPANFTATAVQLTPPSITTASPLPGATQGEAYALTFQSTGGDGSYAYGLAGGTLPAGLSLSAGGVLSGTPTTQGTATFTVQVTSAGASTTTAFSLTVGYPAAFGSIAFQTAPSNAQCNQIIVPHAAVRVLSTSGQPLAGVRVDIVAVTNNGAKVEVSQPFAISGADGRAVFNTLSINKTGAYRLVAGTSAPWPVTSVQSAKFNISPAC